MTNILVVTGDLNQDYQILDSIFAMDSHKESFWKMADPSKAFEGVKGQLKKKAGAIGGDAIINCMFEYRVAEADGFMGKKQVMEIFAYGTAVKRIQQKIQTPQPSAPASTTPTPQAYSAAPTTPAPQAYSAAPTTPAPQAYSAAPTTPAPQAYSAAPTTPPPAQSNPFALGQGSDILDDIL